MSHARKRSRSISSTSTSSISTISTDRSISPKRARRDGGDQYVLSQQEYEDPPGYLSRERKRRRKSSSSVSESRSDLSLEKDRRNGNCRRRRRTVSPEARGRPVADRRGSRRRRSQSRNFSLNQGRVAQDRKSMTPVTAGINHPGHDCTLHTQENSRYAKDGINGGWQDAYSGGDMKNRRKPPCRKKRSLSPYSKRIALTQAMNMGQ